MSTPAPKRCAIYTRKSTEEGLEQDYNSLDAQRDAARAFIASQQHEGWIATDDCYDDGCYSGGTMERPALKRLLADIETGQINIVVVYKIDRLTRSLMDFSKIIEVFDRHGVSFVAVTQQFNTTTSMGRLTLNILLSFAQFEREVTGERIRDKFAASKKKGLWMGGCPPLGYDVKDRQLVVNEAEAKTVRRIFADFVRLRSSTELVRKLAAEGITTKALRSRKGVSRPGQRIDKKYLHRLLRNRLYRGEMTHKGVAYPGQHPAIILKPLWEQVQAILAESHKGQGAPGRPRSRTEALLRGLLFAPDGEKMRPTFTRKPNGKRYRYYVSTRDHRFGAGAGSIGALPALEIEDLVLAQVQAALGAPEVVQATWERVQTAEPGIDEPTVVLALRNLSTLWAQLFPAEQQRIVQLLIERVQLREGGVDIQWRESGWQQLAGELTAGTIGGELREWEEAAACA